MRNDEIYNLFVIAGCDVGVKKDSMACLKRQRNIRIGNAPSRCITTCPLISSGTEIANIDSANVFRCEKYNYFIVVLHRNNDSSISLRQVFSELRDITEGLDGIRFDKTILSRNKCKNV